MTRKFQGIWIPSELWLTNQLTMQEKLFLVEINSLDNENGCFATNSYFAKFFNISKTRVTTILNRLIEKGFINREIVYKQGSKEIDKRVLKICSPPYPTKVVYPHKGILDSPTQQKLSDNNTITNNTTNNTTNNKETVSSVIKSYTDNELLRESIIGLKEYRTKRGKSFTIRAMKLLLKKLDTLFKNDEEKITALDTALERGWLTVYEPKKDNFQNKQEDSNTSFLDL